MVMRNGTESRLDETSCELRIRKKIKLLELTVEVIRGGVEVWKYRMRKN